MRDRGNPKRSSRSPGLRTSTILLHQHQLFREIAKDGLRMNGRSMIKRMERTNRKANLLEWVAAKIRSRFESTARVLRVFPSGQITITQSLNSMNLVRNWSILVLVAQTHIAGVVSLRNLSQSCTSLWQRLRNLSLVTTHWFNFLVLGSVHK